MCAFPLHLWTLLLAFRDLSWLTDRTNAWDAVGVASYGLVFALIESVTIFLVLVLLGFLVSKQWGQNRRIALLTILALIVSLWAMVSQLFFLLGISPSGWILNSLAQTAHPVRIMYIAFLVVVTPTILVPAWLVLRSDKFFQFLQVLIDRLSLLTMFYLVFDFIGLVIVIIRNV